MIRKIITIQGELCDGCGECAAACSEGAIKIIDGKARLVKDEYCDGFGDCLVECPNGALTIESRDTVQFDENATKQYLFLTAGHEAVWNMEESQRKHKAKEYSTNLSEISLKSTHGNLKNGIEKIEGYHNSTKSELKNWPIQLHLVPMKAPYYHEANLLLAADCCSYTYADFHNEFMTNNITIIGCPKLDDTDLYLAKLATIFNENEIKSLTITYMEVPCCRGIVRLANEALKKTNKDISIREVKLSIHGKIII